MACFVLFYLFAIEDLGCSLRIIKVLANLLRWTFVIVKFAFSLRSMEVFANSLWRSHRWTAIMTKVPMITANTICLLLQFVLILYFFAPFPFSLKPWAELIKIGLWLVKTFLVPCYCVRDVFHEYWFCLNNYLLWVLFSRRMPRA